MWSYQHLHIKERKLCDTKRISILKYSQPQMLLYSVGYVHDLSTFLSWWVRLDSKQEGTNAREIGILIYTDFNEAPLGFPGSPANVDRFTAQIFYFYSFNFWQFASYPCMSSLVLSAAATEQGLLHLLHSYCCSRIFEIFSNFTTWTVILIWIRIIHYFSVLVPTFLAPQLQTLLIFWAGILGTTMPGLH
jgi:hypothetical protein